LVGTNLSRLLNPITWSIALTLLSPTFIAMLATVLTSDLLVATLSATILILAGALLVALKLHKGVYRETTG
jgi:hypothetical protein